MAESQSMVRSMREFGLRPNREFKVSEWFVFFFLDRAECTVLYISVVISELLCGSRARLVHVGGMQDAGRPMFFVRASSSVTRIKSQFTSIMPRGYARSRDYVCATVCGMRKPFQYKRTQIN